MKNSFFELEVLQISFIEGYERIFISYSSKISIFGHSKRKIVVICSLVNSSILISTASSFRKQETDLINLSLSFKLTFELSEEKRATTDSPIK